MLVIHPKDKTTAMLSALYDGQEAQVVDDCRSTKTPDELAMPGLPADYEAEFLRRKKTII